MAERPPHKRTRSALALTILRGGRPPKETTSSEPASPTPPSPSSGKAPNMSNSPITSMPGASSSATDAPPEPTMSQESLATIDKVSPSGLQTSATSIEESVRTFRIFEVLRSGDTAAIRKAIDDSHPSTNSLNAISGTTILHLAIQCAEPQIVEYVISHGGTVDVNAQDREGNTPLHLAAQLGRAAIVKQLLEQTDINDSVTNHHGRTPIDLARTPEIFQQLQLARSLLVDHIVHEVHALVAQSDFKKLEGLLEEPRVEGALDVNALELATDKSTLQTGGTLLHEAAKNKDMQLIQILLMHGADPFRRDRNGKLPQDVTKDERTRAILKKSPAAAVAQRGVQEKAILGSNPAKRGASAGSVVEGSKDAREMKGYLKKWTNYTSGYKLRWFVLEDGVMSYYKHQDDAGSACRGAINMRIATLHIDAQDKSRFEIHGKSSVKYHLKANHVVEAKRWFWSLNNAIQYAKDEAKEDEKRRARDAETLRQAKIEASDKLPYDGSDGVSTMSSRPKSRFVAPAASGTTGSSSLPPGTSPMGSESLAGDDAASMTEPYEPSIAEDLTRFPTYTGVGTADMDDHGYDDDASVAEVQPVNKDAFNITAQSAKLQLDLLARVSSALEAECANRPDLPVSDPTIVQALSTYDTAVSSLSGLVADLLKISRDREAYWQYKLDRESDARKMWEESMTRVAQEQDDLQKTIDESEEKRKRTKKALKEALEAQSMPGTPQGETVAAADRIQFAQAFEKVPLSRDRQVSSFQMGGPRRKSLGTREGGRRKSVIAQYTNISDSESGDDEEFFDAIDAGEVEVVPVPPVTAPPAVVSPPPAAGAVATTYPFDAPDERTHKQKQVESSFAGYEDGVRSRLKMDVDNRPKISLWGILKSMIGKDMTKMTLPVSFNEPTSLLQRVAEDMEYAELLDAAADRIDSTERLVYVATFAASEYASTIGRVAKPFNPLLGETYEYVRPDKGYRFVIEQVSHHPPIGAAYADSAKWDYWGESAVKSKFYGKSFEINPLGTWFLRLRPAGGGPLELYTWKKVTSSVVGIITGSPTVDNYGPMEIKNWNTGEVCVLDFKQRGWKASSAFQVSGKVVGKDGVTKWSIGGRWNDKIYARLTPGFEDENVSDGKVGRGGSDSNQAFLVWQANKRPTGIPFNLTPFVVTLNAVSDHLRPKLPPTDTRLRPDQRAMEDGEYDAAADEKTRVEEKQRATRRKREANGEEFKPKWFEKMTDKVTGEDYWETNGEYWKCRQTGDWTRCEDIF